MKLFEKNIGQLDKIVRVVIGILALIFAFLSQGVVMYISAIIGVLLILTAALGTCGLYTIFGINTCSIGKKENTKSDKKPKKRKK